MVSVARFASAIGDYQRPYLTVFRIEKTPDDLGNVSETAMYKYTADQGNYLKELQAKQVFLQASLDAAMARFKVKNIDELLALGRVPNASAEFANILKLNTELIQVTSTFKGAEKLYTAYYAALQEQDSLYSHYAAFKDMIENIDIYSIKAVFPERKTTTRELYWEGEQFFYRGRSESQKQDEFTFILDQDMRLLPLLYLMKDLTGTEGGEYAARRGNPAYGEYSQEFDFGIFQISTDRYHVTNYVRLVGVRVYEVGGIKADKSDEGQQIQTVSVKCAWDYNQWDDRLIGYPYDANKPVSHFPFLS
jgi:hypothetical protein